ncbi:hypothetical protein AVE30378_01939 [Achromobacter veterisilvae]|uniref:Uncharacterized protein n=1 Tax=Achromobacter veterisilvae TaxID=2069367 RepID=A0A446CEE5_9BURK|nr:hypothetical protein AVE30378_01939 [Achromobacter veterisilvae]
MKQGQRRALQGLGFGLGVAGQQFDFGRDGGRAGAAHAGPDAGLAGGGSEGGDAFLVQDGERQILMRPVRA